MSRQTKRSAMVGREEMTFEEFWKQNRDRYLCLFGTLAIHTAAEEAWDIVSNDLDSTLKELEELRVLHKIAWTNEKKLTEELEYI